MQTFKKSSAPKLLTKFFDTAHIIKVCSNDRATDVIGEIKARDNLKIANLMQNLL